MTYVSVYLIFVVFSSSPPPLLACVFFASSLRHSPHKKKTHLVDVSVGWVDVIFLLYASSRQPLGREMFSM